MMTFLITLCVLPTRPDKIKTKILPTKSHHNLDLKRIKRLSKLRNRFRRVVDKSAMTIIFSNMRGVSPPILLLVCLYGLLQCCVEAETRFLETSKLQGIEPDLTLMLPEEDEDPSTINLVGLGTNGAVRVLLNTADTDVLVVLARRNADTMYIPVSRSYNGFDWEAGPGLHQRLPITCADYGNDRKCQLVLDNSNEDDAYFLTRYTRTVSDDVRIARFLEMATFGPTLSLINNFDYNNVDYGMANFVKDQIENQHVSKHREFYRRHLNVRAVETYKHGVTGPGACERNSRWRSFAFTTKDLAMSNKDASFALTVETTTTPSPAYVISFAGFPRTVLYEQLQYYTNERSQSVLGVLSDGAYPICFIEDIEGRKRIDVSSLPNSYRIK